MREVQLFESPRAECRLAAARDFVLARAPGTELLVLGATREAADDFARGIARRSATFGLYRRTLTQLAAELAARRLAAAGLAPTGSLAGAAIAARAVFEAIANGGLAYFAPVADRPGFARAVGATVAELQLAQADPCALSGLGPAGNDLARLLELCQAGFSSAGVADRAVLLRAAAEALDEDGAGRVGRPLLLLDVPLRSPLESALLRALAKRADTVFAVVPPGDDRTLELLEEVGRLRRVTAGGPVARDGLARVQQQLFGPELPGPCAADESVVFFSAPGEARECVEIARRILDAARSGTRFDQIAVLVRAPENYAGHLAEAFRRAGVPAYFATGVRRPDAVGRAFLCFLDFVVEDFAAARFCEYLAFGCLPLGARGGWAAPAEEAFAARALDATEDEAAEGEAANERAQPWRWERLIGDAAVLAGAGRWQRRLEAGAREIVARLQALRGEDTQAPLAAALEADLADLEALRSFALPLIELAMGWSGPASWGEWLDRLSALAPRIVSRSRRVLSVLAELRPLAAVPGVTLAEVREVLSERLAVLQEDPPAHRFGRVFVAGPEQARGRSFEVVFVPGLAERVFPRRPREDPLLLDAARRSLGAHLETQTGRGRHERLLLRLAVGAAGRRLFLSYPRVDVGQARPRVPSFYALEVVRANEGKLPEIDALEHAATAAGGARMAWPAPADPRRAIDSAEYDLAVLEPLLRRAVTGDVAGRARFLIELNAHLGRSLRSRWCRWELRRWHAADGMCELPETTRAALHAHRLGARAYSASALQRFAACPYRFFLAGIARLQPRPSAAPAERLDPLTRGRLFHEVQAAVLRELQRRGLLPFSETRLKETLEVLDAVARQEEARAREELAPAIPRIWDDEMAALRADLRGWLQRAARSAGPWQPQHFELAFGLGANDTRDRHSWPDPVRLPGGQLLRGAIDLVERNADGTAYRVTDHKTGKNRCAPGAVVGGGEMLQPVLYAMAVENLPRATDSPEADPPPAGEGASAPRPRVTEARLWFCTAAAAFGEHVVRIDERARRRALEALEIIDRAIEQGFFPAAPREDACKGCEYREVCGPYEELRWKRKDSRPLQDLCALRSFA